MSVSGASGVEPDDCRCRVKPWAGVTAVFQWNLVDVVVVLAGLAVGCYLDLPWFGRGFCLLFGALIG